MAISEFSVSTSNTNKWASVKTSAVGGDTKYGIYVTNKSNPRYTFQNSNFYPSSTEGSVAIVELYANSEGSGTGDPNTYSGTIYDGVALVNMGPPTGALSSNTSVYGIYSSSKIANYVYNFANNGYADTKKMAIGGNKNRRVFAIRSWGNLNPDHNKPYIAFIGDSSALKYDGTSAEYSVGCAGATKTTSANTWVSHTAGDGTKYYSITNAATTNANVYADITLTQYHTYRFTLHAHTEASFDGVAICKTNTTSSFNSLTASQLLSGNTSTGKCSGKDKTTTFNYTPATSESVYIYFKSDGSTIGPGDGMSFADVMVEDLGDLRAEQDAPTAANVTVEYEETATASVSGGGGQGELQYEVHLSGGVWLPWVTTVPTRTAIGTTTYMARYAGNASYKPSPASNVATLQVTPKKITKPTAKTSLVYNGSQQAGLDRLPLSAHATSEGTLLASNAGSYNVTFTLTDTTNYCWNDGTTSPVTVNWKITPLTADLIWGTTSWLYDGTAHSTTCRLRNLVGSDTCTVTLSDNNSIMDVGTIWVTATALSNSNYRLPASDSLKTVKLTIHPCMYIKAGNEWVPVKLIYKKVNGSWVLQTTEATIRSLFSEAGRYLERYPL